MNKDFGAIRIFQNVNFETASSACILSENVVYLALVLRVESLLDLLRVFEVASAAAELNVDGVVCCSWADVVDGRF